MSAPAVSLLGNVALEFVQVMGSGRVVITHYLLSARVMSVFPVITAALAVSASLANNRLPTQNQLMGSSKLLGFGVFYL